VITYQIDEATSPAVELTYQTDEALIFETKPPPISGQS
jgi:hypothetical protein